MKRLPLGIAILLLTGCDHTYPVVPSPAVVAETSLERQINYAVSYYIEPELSSLTQNATVSGLCSARQFPVNAGPAIAASIRSVNQTAFKYVAEGGTTDQPASGVQRHFVYSLESFAPRLIDAVQEYGGMLGDTKIADVSLAIAVDAYDESGKQIFHTAVSGNGHSTEETGLLEGKFCSGAADALQAATNQAIKQSMADYVDRVVKRL